LHANLHNGGHTIARHVGKSVSYLLRRLESSKAALRIVTIGEKRSGSFSSLPAAEKLGNSTLAQNKDRVDMVVRGAAVKSAVVSATFSSPTGIEAYKADARTAPIVQTVYGVQVVIQHAPDTREGFVVVTAFPTSNVKSFPGVTQ
jgi:hypothetical protein